MSSAKRVMRRLLGLSAELTPQTERRPRGRGRQPAAETPVNPFLRSSSQVAPPQAEGFEVAPAEGRGSAAVGRWVLRGFLALLIVIGVWSAFVRPFIDKSDDDDQHAPMMNISAAEATASRYALDYLTWSPGTTNAGRAAALSAAMLDGATERAVEFTGSGYLLATAAVPANVRSLGNDSAVVIVDVRVVVGAPGKGVKPLTQPPAGAQSTTPDASETTAREPKPEPSSLVGEPAAAADSIPKGYVVKATVWVRLAVPIIERQGLASVGAAGPAFVGELSAGPVAADTDPTADPAATASTQEWIATFMAAYAASSTEYQAAEGVTLQGLRGVAGVGDVGTWALTSPNAGGLRSGTVAVTWRLAAADLTITQTYTLGVMQDADRWYVSTIGPVNPVGGI